MPWIDSLIAKDMPPGGVDFDRLPTRLEIFDGLLQGGLIVVLSAIAAVPALSLVAGLVVGPAGIPLPSSAGSLWWR